MRSHLLRSAPRDFEGRNFLAVIGPPAPQAAPTPLPKKIGCEQRVLPDFTRLVYLVKEWCVGITHIEDHHPQRLGPAAVVARHSHVRRHYHRLAGLDRVWLAPLHFHCECTLQDIDCYGKTMPVEHSLIAGLEARREDAHLLPIASRYPLKDLAQE